MVDDAPRRFAVEHAGYTEDLAFWRETAGRLGSPILDLGAASGRVSIPLARDGHEVWALDASPAMLAELEGRLAAEPSDVRGRVRAVRGRLDDFVLDRSFALVMVAMNTLQVLLDPVERDECFRRMAEHLAPRGEVVFDVALPDRGEILASLGVERDGMTHEDPSSGALIAQSAWYESYDDETRTLSFVTRVRDLAGPEAGAERLRRHTVHLFSRGEIADLLSRAGLRAVGVFGDFRGGPLTARSERQVYRCVAAGAAA